MREPPVRFRRLNIPVKVKLRVAIAQARCASCGEPLINLESTQFDHQPALGIRPYSISAADYDPPQLDPDFIEAVHCDCHQWRTTGRKPGAAKTVTTVGSDVHAAAKIKRMNSPPKKHKRKIKSRGFSKQQRKFQRRKQPL